MFAVDLKTRVQSRLDALKINAFEADRRGGLSRGFVRDILVGDKLSVQKKNLAGLAFALECDPAFLTGHQPMPRIDPRDVEQGLPVTLTCETGTWRSLRAGATQALSIPVLPDPRWPGLTTVIAQARGDGADLVGIPDGSFAIGVDFAQYAARGSSVRDGALCIVKRVREMFDEVELSIRRCRIEGDEVLLVAPSSTAYREVRLGESKGENVEIVALVTGIFTSIG